MKIGIQFDQLVDRIFFAYFSPRAAGFTAVLVGAQGSLEVGGGVGEVVLLPSLLPHESVEALDPLLLSLKVAHLVPLVVHHGPDVGQTSRVIRT